MPYNIGEEKTAYGHMNPYPYDTAASGCFKLYAGCEYECRCKDKHPIA
ncbi:hypothetical protein [uncultured Muribaculum sp.]|nr:hypothetical protein [uncultured Muribaculum sp.]